MLKWWRVPLYPDWINVENTIIWLVTFQTQISNSNSQIQNKLLCLPTLGARVFFFPLAWSIGYRATSRGKKPSGHGGWEPHFHDLELWTQSLIGFRGQCQSFLGDNDLTPIFTGWTPIVLQKPVFSSRNSKQEWRWKALNSSVRFEVQYNMH